MLIDQTHEHFCRNGQHFFRHPVQGCTINNAIDTCHCPDHPFSPEQVLHIFVEIARGRGNHGSFLRSFAEAYQRADDANVLLLRQPALALIKKYQLDKYLSNFGEE